jgi:hypothetical protein
MGDAVFERCDFLMGRDDSVVIVIPGNLPRAETYTVSVSDRDIKFRADYSCIAEMLYQGGEIFRRIANTIQVGLVEYSGTGDFPASITNVAYVEVRRAG